MPASDLCRVGNDLRTSQRSVILKIILHVDLLSILPYAFARYGVFFNIGAGRDALCFTNQLDKELGDYKAPVSSVGIVCFVIWQFHFLPSCSDPNSVARFGSR